MPTGRDEELWVRFNNLIHCTDGHNRQALAALVAEEVAKEREACAALCERIWKDSPNERPHYRQNAIADGCIECAAAIRSRSAP